MSTIALWFMVGAIISLYNLLVDFKISRKNKIIIYKRYCKEGDLPLSASEFYSMYYPLETTIFTLLGPAGIYMFYGKCKVLTKESNSKVTHS